MCTCIYSWACGKCLVRITFLVHPCDGNRECAPVIGCCLCAGFYARDVLPPSAGSYQGSRVPRVRVWLSLFAVKDFSKPFAHRPQVPQLRSLPGLWAHLSFCEGAENMGGQIRGAERPEFQSQLWHLPGATNYLSCTQRTKIWRKP